MQFRTLILWLAMFAVPAQAYEFGGLSIEVPDGFEGPRAQSLPNGFKMTAFTYPHSDGTGTLLQVTVWEPEQELPEFSAKRRKQVSQRYLLQLLGGVERSRKSFRREEVEFVRIAGLPAAKVAWNGQVFGQDVHGVMYCLIARGKVYSLHTQDLASYSETYTEKAEHAFEAAEIAR